MTKKKISKKSKRRLMIFGVLSVFAIGYFCVTLVGYVYSYISLKQEEKNLNAELVSLQDQKANLKIEIQKLNDPDYVARYAKEKYLYSSDGEYVLKIDTEEKEESIEKKQKNYLFAIAGGVILFLTVIIVIKKKNSSK